MNIPMRDKEMRFKDGSVNSIHMEKQIKFQKMKEEDRFLFSIVNA